MNRNLRPLAVAFALAIVGAVSACSSAATSSGQSTASTPVSSAPASSVAASAPAPPASSGPLAGPCDLLSVDQIASATKVQVADGEQSIDNARQVQMCTWKSSDPFLIVAASLTDVAAEEAFKTNVDLAPAYFDGEAKTISVPGADKAYAVQQPDVGWVVGAIAKGRFLQVQVGGNEVTQAQVATLVENAIARMAG